MTTKLKHWLEHHAKNIENNNFNELFFRCPNGIMKELIDTLRIANINIPSYIYDYGKCVTYLNDLFECVTFINVCEFSKELQFKFEVAKLTRLYDKQKFNKMLYDNTYCLIIEEKFSLSAGIELLVSYKPNSTTNKVLVDCT